DEVGVGSVAKRVYEVDGMFIVVQVTAKGQPKVEDFDKDADKTISQLRAIRSRIAIDEFLKARCEALAKDNKIQALDHVRDVDSEGKPVQSYRPCIPFH